MYSHFAMERLEDEFYQVLNELRELPTVNKSEKAIENKKVLLFFNSRITQVLEILTPEEQLAFLMASKDEIDANKLATVVKGLTNVAHRNQFMADQTKKITAENLVDIAEALYPESKNRLAFYLGRIKKVNQSNFYLVVNSLAVEDKEKFIEDHKDRLTIINIAGVLAFISEAKRFEFLKEHLALVDSNNLVEVLNLLALELKEEFIKLKPTNVTSYNLAAVSSQLPEARRMPFISDEHKALVNPKNVVEVGKTVSSKHLPVLLSHCISKQNFAALTTLFPEDSQLEFFNAAIHRLQGERAGIWLESIGKLTRPIDRYAVVMAHQNEIIREDDIFSVVWAMEQLAAADAVKFAKLHFDKVKSAQDFISLADCKALDFASRLELIEAYKPQMLKQTDKGQQTFEVRKYFGQQLSLVTGNQYPRLNNTDLQALNILINIAKANLGVKTSQHDPKVFGGSATAATAVTAVVTETASMEQRFTA